MSIKYTVEIHDENYESWKVGLYKGKVLKYGGYEHYDLSESAALKVVKEARKKYTDREGILIFISFRNTNDGNNFGYLNPVGGHSPVGKNWNN